MDSDSVNSKSVSVGYDDESLNEQGSFASCRPPERGEKIEEPLGIGMEDTQARHWEQEREVKNTAHVGVVFENRDADTPLSVGKLNGSGHKGSEPIVPVGPSHSKVGQGDQNLRTLVSPIKIKEAIGMAQESNNSNEVKRTLHRSVSTPNFSALNPPQIQEKCRKMKKIANPCECKSNRRLLRSCIHRPLVGAVTGETFVQQTQMEESSDSDFYIQLSNKRNWDARNSSNREDLFGLKLGDVSESEVSDSLGRCVGFGVNTERKHGTSGDGKVQNQINVISLNSNGLGEVLKRRWICSLKKKFRSSVVFLQETHLPIVEKGTVCDCWGGDDFEFEFVNSEGRSGGICTIWNPHFFIKEDVIKEANFLALKGTWLPLKTKVLLVNVYAPNSLSTRTTLRSNLLTVLTDSPNYCCLLGGDFNEVRRSEERKGTSYSFRGAEGFNNFIDSANLWEPHLGGRRFTWSSADGTKASKLDRFLLSRNSSTFGQDTSVCALAKIYSDHCPIILDLDTVDYGPPPFKFFNSWLKSDSLAPLVVNAWNYELSDFENGANLPRLCKKLKRLKEEIKVWKKEESIRRNGIKDVCNVKLNALEVLDETVGLSEGERAEKINLVDQIRNVDAKALEDLKQKAKVRWLKEGMKTPVFSTGWWEREEVSEGHRLSFRSEKFHKISKEQATLLTSPFSAEEIKEAVWSCGGDKARRFWEVIGADVVAAVKDFEKNPMCLFGRNESFITLVPKTADPLSLNDYRPIHLTGCVSKIVSKVLAERLKPVLDSIISPEQSAFVKGRNIIDGPLIVDLEKAFDNLVWDFLWEIMEQMGFGSIWLDWMKGVVCSAKVSVLVNGSPTKNFPLEKGVRQGDPLSSLHYADDALFLGEWSKRNLRNILKILQCFYRASGLRVNWRKSAIHGIGVPSIEINEVANSLGCKVGNLPFTYLGIPIGDRMKKKRAWKTLFDKFRNKLSNWKAKILSSGGRLTLCKTVLGSLGTYLFSLFKAPSGVLKELERLRRKFFWGMSDGIKKIPWIRWDVVLNSKAKGGLDIGSLSAQNVAMLAKWWWRFKNEESALWRRVICAFHGAFGKLGLASEGNNCRSTWGTIAKLGKEFDSANLDFDSLCRKKLGNGEKTRFWHDRWIGNYTLANKFPRLFALDIDKECSVASRMAISANGASFRGNWRRSLRDGRETDEAENLASICESSRLGTGEDRWIWELEASGLFSVASLRRAIDDMRLGSSNHRTIWTKEVPGKVRILLWKARANRLPTKSNLIKRNVPVGDERCVLCQSHIETIDHLFVGCCKAEEVRKAVNKWWNIFPNGCNLLSDIIDRGMEAVQTDRTYLVRSVVKLAYIWTMWLGRNDAIFKQVPFNPLRTANLIQSTSYHWLDCRSSLGSRLTWQSWCCNPLYLVSRSLCG
ncbi:LOW QUALITY PROTEIN: hypothetical protein OSB04_015824 [Centaurea solstitialis]|uniref:Reverse transcriptase domain-containing protein n=1 Tax=Centaurea solstitialis TaxID=347529 RepID=A0AA38WJ44_9ASTR|nr:LOW QUALITY PROTEIN: hypothetical protein OSB04_015824 [Centaurea solstitialis]